MPLNPLVSAIVSSVIESVANVPPVAPPPYEQLVGIPRVLPQDARAGVMSPPLLGTVQIDGQTMAFAAGAQIRDPLNMIVLPTMIQQAVMVRYTTDPSGAVWRVWILSGQEAAAVSSR